MQKCECWKRFKNRFEKMQGPNHNFQKKGRIVKSYRGAAFAWFIFGILAAGSIFSTIQTATSGAVISSYEQEEAVLEKENLSLYEELANYSSLLKIENDADELGYKTPERIIYITNEEGVAKLP